jgi:eukaryotic-like serine/threonine-protein kinase
MSSSSTEITRLRPLPGEGPLAALVERLVEDMGKRWRQGECPRTEEYLAQHPELVEHPEAALELVYEEVCLSREHGQALTEADVAQRFPRWRKKLHVLFGFHQLLETGPTPPVFPEVDEVLGDFKLLAKLGQGALGHVFLATQPGLADRAVVLKLTPCRGQEHLSLARLQHTHIVPLYSVHHFPERNLRALCMPYFGGATLASILDALAACPPALRSGKHVVEALRQAQDAVPLLVPVDGPLCQFLEGASYTKAICWLGACLADALYYARAHGLVHLDIKPSNVLVAADGQPMLLDFHLARAPLAEGADAPEWLGGTPVYMAPEQREGVEAVRKNQPMPAAVDERTDVYALGMTLFEALGGPMPLRSAKPGAALRRCNPQVSMGLADIVARCLAPDRDRRYPDAASLAADLRLHLADRPLRGVANRSLSERWHKWRRRRPYAIALGGLLLALAGAGILVGGYFARGVNQAHTFLKEGIKHKNQASLEGFKHKDELQAAVSAFKHGLKAVEGLPYEPGVVQQLRTELVLAERVYAVAGFHDFMEGLRAIYGEGVPPAAVWAKVNDQCQRFWDNRELIARPPLPPPSEIRERNRQDLLDLAVIWTDVQIRRAGKNAAPARGEALAVLKQAEELCDRSMVLYRERAANAAALGLTEVAGEASKQAAALKPNTAWEQYAVGRSLLRDGDVAGATAAFDRALRHQPGALWPNFYRGKIAYQQRHYEEAFIFFNTCLANNDKLAWCWANRGLSYAALGRTDNALFDFNKALKLDSRLAVALLNRGLLYFRAGRHADALVDLHEAIHFGADSAEVYHDLALVYLAQGDRTAAQASLDQALRADPAYQPARALAEKLKHER